jgi:thiamine biosynthesis lipoprotein
MMNLLKPTLLLFVLFLFSCTDSHVPVSQTKIHLGTFVTITDYDSTLEKALIESSLDSAFQAIADIEATTNPFDPQSTIGKINQLSREQANFSISPQLFSVLSSARDISVQSQGSFDFTIWPVFKLWNFGSDSARVPDSKEIEQALILVNFRNAQLDSNRISFTKKGMEIDLGGIIKGYAVEIARGILIRNGLRDFIIDAGGNLGIEWHKRLPVQVKVRHPRRDGKFWCEFPIDSSVGIATSGDYQYYFIDNNNRYHHILDTRTGFPAKPTVSATIIARDAIQADGYSTAVFVMGPVRGSELIESHPELEGLMIFPLEGHLDTYVSSGLKKTYTALSDEE